MKFLLIRHAESEANKRGLWQGDSIDMRLSSRGQVQARECADMLKNAHVSRIIASHRKRAQETAQIVCGNRQLSIESSIVFDEIMAPKWDGLRLSDVETSDEHNVWCNDMHCEIDGVENLATLQARVVKGLLDIISNEQPDAVTVIVSHALALRMLICWVIGLAPTMNRTFHLSNASVTYLNVNEKTFAQRLPRGISLEALNVSSSKIASIAT